MCIIRQQQDLDIQFVHCISFKLRPCVKITHYEFQTF